jgi:superfamily II DNA or RNA helicase
MPELWPHQERAVAAVKAAVTDAVRGGPKKYVLSLPTGMGKTVVAHELARWALDQGGRVALYTNRRMMIDQLSRGLRGASFDYGVRCAGHGWDHDEPLQLASVQTEYSRSVKGAEWELHAADLAIVDEAHIQRGKGPRSIIEQHAAAGALVLGLTATPIELGDIYDRLIVAGCNSDGYACGALVRATHYGCDEPDTRHVKGIRLGEELSENQARKIMGAVEDGRPTVRLQQLFGRVVEQFNRLNPQRKPTILFAPGVKESIWLAEQFTDRGIRAAHIDGNEIWIDGNRCQSTTEARDRVAQLSRTGLLPVVCNRFVLREGVDWPWLAHGIFATVFGSLQTYLQSGGRLLRAHPSLTGVTVQDHGGNYWRHGSLNADRTWDLTWPAYRYTNEILSVFTDPKSEEKKPFPCPKCMAVMAWRPTADATGMVVTCPQCGYSFEFERRTRPVIQADGELIEMRGDPAAPRVGSLKSDTQKKWEGVFWRCRKSGKTFNQAMGLFFRENGYYPVEDLPLMPRRRGDFNRKVSAVPFSDLIPKENVS